MHLGHEFVEMRAALVHDQALLKKHIHQHGLAAPDVAVNIEAARRRLVLVREQPAKQALLAQGLVARKLLLEAREGFGGLGLRGVGFNRARGDEGLIMGAERGGWCVQHGPLTTLGQRKLQAGIWGWGYAGARIGDAAPAFRKPSYPPTGPIFGRPDDRLQRVSSTPRRFDSITGALE